MSRDPNNDKALKDALRAWTVQTPLPPCFQKNVWRRIEAAECEQQCPTAWALLVGWFSRFMARPAVTVAYATVLVAVGVTLGVKQVQTTSTHLENRLGQRYVQSVDPFQMPRGQ